MNDLRSPFPWFGGKRRVAHLVWERFGNVPNYVEPFFGSGAVLLERPSSPGIETVNDLDCFVANFWRALSKDPDAVASFADWPVNEADQHARHLWLVNRVEFREKMKTDPDFYDPKIAGWWVWGQCIWIGAGWCGPAGMKSNGDLHAKRPSLSNAGKGVHRKLPHLGDAGRGVNRNPGQTPKGEQSLEYMTGLAARLRNVRVCCGDWSRVCGPTPTVKQGVTGVFLDPPYNDESNRTEGIYAEDDPNVSRDVLDWAISNGCDPRMRIALCGYEGEHKLPNSWECVPWKAAGGYGSQADKQGRANSAKERIWFSPYCLKMELFESKK